MRNISQTVRDREFVSTEDHYKVAYGLSKKIEIFDFLWSWKVRVTSRNCHATVQQLFWIFCVGRNVEKRLFIVGRWSRDRPTTVALLFSYVSCFLPILDEAQMCKCCFTLCNVTSCHVTSCHFTSCVEWMSKMDTFTNCSEGKDICMKWGVYFATV